MWYNGCPRSSSALEPIPLSFLENLVMRVLMALLGLLISLPLMAKSPEVCSTNANSIIQWTQMRDTGVSKKDFLEALDLSTVPEAYRNQMKKDILEELDIIYGNSKTPLANAQNYFFRCLKQPDYQKESNT
jgi:hypothetical protein